MRVLVVPSWFPSAHDPVAGIFIADQVKALSVMPGISVTVLSWGHGDSHVPLHNPISALRTLVRYFWHLVSKRERVKVVSQLGVDVLYAPALTISSKVSEDWYSVVLGAADRAVGRAIKNGQSFDIIHAHSLIPAGVVAMTISEKYSIPYIITEHTFPNRIPGALRSGVLDEKLHQVFRGASKVFAVSNSLAREMSDLGIADVDVLPNVFDDTVFVPQRAPNLESGALNLLAVANATDVKGFDVLLRAVADYRHRLGGEVSCVIAGGGPAQKELQNLKKTLGLCDEVTFEGALSRPQLLKRYRDCTAVVISSHRETFCLVGLEALACGRLVVSTRCGGPEDYIDDRKNGLLVNVNSPQELAHAFAELKSLIASYSAKVIADDISAKYSSRTFAKTLVKIYDDVIVSTN